MLKNKRLSYTLLLGTTAFFMAGLWKMQVVFGSHSLFFTASNIVGPLLGLGVGPWAVLALMLMKRAVLWTFFGGSLLSLFSTYLPTLCAAWYWRMPSITIRFMVPLICMIAFVIHPVGAQVWIYAMYWLIPLTLYLMPKKSVFTHALAATFIQHSVGSVIWLYCMPTTPALWYSLMPVVIMERLVFALGMVVVLHSVRRGAAFLFPQIMWSRAYPFFFGESTYTSN